MSFFEQKNGYPALRPSFVSYFSVACSSGTIFILGRDLQAMFHYSSLVVLVALSVQCCPLALYGLVGGLVGFPHSGVAVRPSDSVRVFVDAPVVQCVFETMIGVVYCRQNKNNTIYVALACM